MAGKFLLEVVTPERKVFSEEIEGLVVPATEGYLGVLYNHAPLVTGLEPGVITYQMAGAKQKMAVTGGFMEVSQNHAVILADAAELAQEINVDRARRALERAEKRLAERGADGLDVSRVEIALKRALARLKAAE